MSDNSEPAKGQTWRCTLPRREHEIVLVEAGPRRVAYHNARKELRSMSRDTLRNGFTLVAHAGPPAPSL